MSGTYSGIKTDEYTFGYLKIENTHPEILYPDSPDGGWYGCRITVTNTSNHGAISDCKVNLDLDDNSHDWDMFFRDGGNNPMNAPHIDFGSLSPGKSCSQVYRIAPERLGNEAGKNFTCTINIYPSYNIDFHGSETVYGNVDVNLRDVPAPNTGGFN